MSSLLVAALSVVISIVAIVVVIAIFKYVRQLTNQLQQFGRTLNDIQSRVGGAAGGSATSSVAAAPVQPAPSTRASTSGGTPRIFIQKQGHGSPKTRPIDPKVTQPGMAGMAPPPTVVTAPAVRPPSSPPPPPPPPPKTPESESEAFINFDCPHCRQNLDAPPGMAGTQITCPACNKPIAIPTAKPKPAAAPQPAVKSDNVFQENPMESAKKDVTIRIDLNASPELQEPDQASIMVKRPGLKVRRA